jgi:uncharacterized Zn finger protein
VEGGLKARSKRGAIAQTWWSERFIAVLEDIGMGNRLQRGRSYARRGQVISLDVDAGSVTAQVQGSRARPYRVRVGLRAFGKAQWAKVERELAGNAWYLAKLLACEMPDDIEDVFEGVGLSLFPGSAGELSLDCSCPDWEVPCKHLAATFYLLAESFDDDPFRILAWRGRQREDLLDNLHTARCHHPPPPAQLLRAAGRSSEAEPAGHLQHLLTRPAATSRRHSARTPAAGPAAFRLPSLRDPNTVWHSGLADDRWQRSGCRQGVNRNVERVRGSLRTYPRPVLRARRRDADQRPDRQDLTHPDMLFRQDGVEAADWTTSSGSLSAPSVRRLRGVETLLLLAPGDLDPRREFGALAPRPLGGHEVSLTAALVSRMRSAVTTSRRGTSCRPTGRPRSRSPPE